MLDQFHRPGKASFICGGQWGSEGKGAASAFVARHLAEQGKHFQIVTTNAGVQSGHTSVHNGKKRIFYHLPTYPVIAAEYGYKSWVYLNAGSVIDPDVLAKELKEYTNCCHELVIHPLAAVVTDECREAEQRDDSRQTQIASTRKGVGAALSRKVLRLGVVARDVPFLRSFTHRGAFDLNDMMKGSNQAVLVEIPQGYGLGLNAGFYPHCTSRDCTPMQAMSDAGIHPEFYGHTMMIIRTYPIRVGNIKDDQGKMLGMSGGCYSDQYEIAWGDIGRPSEYTTVTNRPRRLFTFSERQTWEAMAALRPSIVYLTFCDYIERHEREKMENISFKIKGLAAKLAIWPLEIITQYGPSTDDVSLWSAG